MGVTPEEQSSGEDRAGRNAWLILLTLWAITLGTILILSVAWHVPAPLGWAGVAVVIATVAVVLNRTRKL